MLLKRGKYAFYLLDLK